MNGYALADAGIETELIERYGQQLPEFAAFVLLESESGRNALASYYREFIATAVSRSVPLVLDTPTWRASRDWGEKLGFSKEDLHRLNRESVTFLRNLVSETDPSQEIIINGSIGPRYDDFVAGERMTVREAEEYHTPQVRALSEAGADRITSVTTLDAAEGSGVVLAAQAHKIEAAVSFIVREDGLLADGTSLSEAAAAVDAATGAAAAGFLINCAHPQAAKRALDRVDDSTQLNRFFGVRLNAGHEGQEGEGDSPEVFAHHIGALAGAVPSLKVFGGCCGTSSEHIEAVALELQSR